jgi:hypothetical protein
MRIESKPPHLGFRVGNDKKEALAVAVWTSYYATASLPFWDLEAEPSTCLH